MFRNERDRKAVEQFTYNGTPLAAADSFRYLGVLFSSNGKTDLALQARVAAANKMFGMFVRRATAWMFDPTMGERLVSTYIRPVLLYGSEVWGVLRRTKLEAALGPVLKDAGRVVLGLPRNTPAAAVRGELGWLPVWASAQVATLRYVFGLLCKPADRLVCRALRAAIRMGRRGIEESWGRRLRSMLAGQLGMTEQWQALSEASMADDMRAAWRQLSLRAGRDAWQGGGVARAKELAVREWWEAVSSEVGMRGQGGNKLRRYRLVKQQWGMEPYLKVLTQATLRRLVARLRCGVLRLNVEEGRFAATRARQQGKVLDESEKQRLRHCPFCPGCVEDEVHFLTVCPKYQQLRTDMWSRVEGAGVVGVSGGGDGGGGGAAGCASCDVCVCVVARLFVCVPWLVCFEVRCVWVADIRRGGRVRVAVWGGDRP